MKSRTPAPLRPGDRIAIISPATEIRPDLIDSAAGYLRRRGYEPVVMPHARGPVSGTYAASDAARLEDLRTALHDPEVKMIFCSRGGYGCVHLLRHIAPEEVSENPKWILGFSDISALHALWQRAGVASLHASMAKQLALREDSPETDMEMQIAEGKLATPDNPYDIDFEANSKEGKVNVRLTIGADAPCEIAGGNLAVLNGLAGTPWDMLSPQNLKGKILFLEDVGEKIYQVERMLTRLYLSGAFDAAEAIVFGQFTDYQPDKNFTAMEEMIAYRMQEWNVCTPWYTGLPAGHTDRNRPIPIGFPARIV